MKNSNELFIRPPPGSNVEILGEIPRQLKLYATLIPTACSYSLVKDMISNGSVDTAVYGYSVTSRRLHRFDFSHPYSFMERGYLTQKNQYPAKRKRFRGTQTRNVVRCLLHSCNFRAVAAIETQSEWKQQQ